MNTKKLSFAASLFVVIGGTACPPVENEDAIVVGAVLPLTGALASLGQGIENAITLGINHVNEGGGVLDKQLRLEVRDSATDPEQAKTQAAALIALGAPVIIGEAASGVTIPMAEVTSQGQVVQISGASTSPDITTLDDDGFLFRTAVSDLFQGDVLARELDEAGFARISILHTDNVYAGGLADVVEAQFTDLGGQVLARRSSAEGLATDYDFQADLDVVFANAPEAVVLIAYDPDAAGYLKAWNANGGFNGVWYLTDACKVDALIANVGGTALEGVRGTAPVLGGGSGAAKFRADYEATFSADPIVFGENYYDAMIVAALAMARAGEATGVGIRDNLPSVAVAPGDVHGIDDIGGALAAAAAGTDIDYDGASGPVDFDDNGDVAGAIEIWSIESGQFVQRRVVNPE